MAMLHRDKDIKGALDISRAIEQRLDKWKEERFDELVHVLRTKTHTNKRKSTPTMDTETRNRKFTQLMSEGMTQSAMRLISGNNNCSGPLPVTTTSSEQLQNKHPHRQLPHRSLFNLHDPVPQIETLTITKQHILTATKNLQGGYGPSGTDAEH
eukprot:GHVR01185132.1.p1 GENE.GHVR01185132.1~~GHVR01185132.1.p1  ORF type:complete len:154 (-),score=22.64 GHVR01185132.1:791-1252(-)